MSGLFLNAQASVLNLCKTFADDAGLVVFQFDAHADTSGWPNSDLVGPAEFQVENAIGVLEIETLIGISTVDDTSIMRLNGLTDRLFTKLRPDGMFPFLDADSGAVLGTLKVKSPVSALPVARTDTRPLRFIGVRFGTDRAFGS